MYFETGDALSAGALWEGHWKGARKTEKTTGRLPKLTTTLETYFKEEKYKDAIHFYNKLWQSNQPQMCSRDANRRRKSRRSKSGWPTWPWRRRTKAMSVSRKGITPRPWSTTQKPLNRTPRCQSCTANWAACYTKLLESPAGAQGLWRSASSWSRPSSRVIPEGSPWDDEGLQ